MSSPDCFYKKSFSVAFQIARYYQTRETISGNENQ
jgi:hypothetical protein